jgi:hypothetical protein
LTCDGRENNSNSVLFASTKNSAVCAAAVERGKAAVRSLQERGIIDSQGRRVRTDIPADMQECKDRDFGG